MVRIVFLHPDLGIGGAERAVIDGGLALKSRGHHVQFVTAHHNPGHCFPETRDGTLNVTAVGDWLPRSILGRCYALCAYIRMIYAAIFLVFFSNIKFDVIFCDQISACLPVLRFSKARIIFYCHFPDMLLTQRKSFLKKIYRTPIDWLEEKTTGMADCVLVNSKFTASVFHATFKTLVDVQTQVLYPIPDFSSLNKPLDEEDQDLVPKHANTIFLSINRYERKKNLALAIDALGQLKTHGCDIKAVHLIIAGGYDERVLENKQYYLELKSLVNELDLTNNVSFLQSISDSAKRTLLAKCTCLLYTPDREHFGIVPIESMYAKCPVIAVNSGGPLETVVDQVTGYLCEPDAEQFSHAMEKFVTDKGLSRKLGKAANERVVKCFSFAAFSQQLDSIVGSLVRDD